MQVDREYLYAVAENLEAARERIEKTGWHQGSLFKGPRTGSTQAIPDGVPVCTAGALMATSQNGTQVKASEYLVTVVGIDVSGMGIGDWNDKPGRTQQQVLDALSLTAKYVRIEADASE